MQRISASCLIVCVLVGTTAATVHADEPLRLKQQRDNAPADLLSTAEFEAMNDPFFNIVLKSRADITSLKDVETLLQPIQTQRRLFVVDENIANPSIGQSRRAVIAFKGTNAQTNDVLDSNVMLSVFFTSDSFPDAPSSIEAWGWDNHRGRYNYYRMDRTGTPNLQLTWKFRGTSVNADRLSVFERQGTCMRCHVNGAPVMKELAFPWNNWRSFKFTASYMDQQWPVRSHPRMRTLRGAEELETEFILTAITQFNTRRLNQSLLRRDEDGNVMIDANGRATVIEGKRLLRHLFETTEVNLISSGALSGLHPFAPGEPGIPPEEIIVPGTFFLNANLMAGGGTTGYLGIGVPIARDFTSVAKIRPAEYKRLVQDSNLTLGGQRGDANFAWFVPEPSHLDNSMVDRLLRRGVVTKEFVAAVLAIDLERPVFSAARASLLRFVPGEFTFVPTSSTTSGQSSTHPDALTAEVLRQILAISPTSGTVEHDFATLLQDANPVARLQERVTQYLERTRTRLQDSSSRATELSRLFNVAIETRRRMKSHEILGALDETGDRLLPLN
ncbi:MAG: hypothetical protein ACREVK_11105 [Gammaproteobacteria bacterium]